MHRKGIRVLPELDTPGHTHTLPKRLLTACYANRTLEIQGNNWTMEDILKQPINPSEYGEPYTAVYGVHGKYEILNPTKEESFSYVLDLLLEFKDLFPDEYVHLGMDEVYYDCWKSNPELIQFMKDKQFTSLSHVEEYYVSRTLKNVRESVDRKYQIWQDPFDNGVQIDSDAVIQIWKGKYDEDDPNDMRVSWMEYARQVAAKSQLFTSFDII
jgi:hexosaminidase